MMKKRDDLVWLVSYLNIYLLLLYKIPICCNLYRRFAKRVAAKALYIVYLKIIDILTCMYTHTFFQSICALHIVISHEAVNFVIIVELFVNV